MAVLVDEGSGCKYKVSGGHQIDIAFCWIASEYGIVNQKNMILNLKGLY